MNHLLVLPDFIYAGHCTSGGSNKDWAACLAVEVEDQITSPPMIDETTEVVFLSLHGPHGGNLIIDPPKKLAMKQAQAHFTKKCKEKDGKAYAQVSFTSYLPAFGRPFGLPLVVPASFAQSNSREASSSLATPASALHYQACAARAISWAQLQQVLSNPDYGATEKVNGERCLIVFDGQQVSAFNRKGQPMSAPPSGALHLRQLASPCVIDGERLTGDLAGHFVAFDLLEWNHVVLTTSAYAVRITVLEKAMRQAGLLTKGHSAATYAQARATSAVADLALLVPATGPKHMRRVVEEIHAVSGEGVVVRKLEGRYDESPLKFKFVADIDAFVFAINEGLAGGSLKMGVRRPADGGIIEVGNVRAGLTEADMHAVRQMLEQGERPVFTVTYLPARTIGLQLVEPRTSMTLLRSDKDAIQCTTDQFGPEKAALIAQAEPVKDITLP